MDRHGQTKKLMMLVAFQPTKVKSEIRVKLLVDTCSCYGMILRAQILCFRGCWFQRAKPAQQHHNSDNKFHQIIATIEVNEEFFHWYVQKTNNGEISSVPDGIYITNPKFGGYTSVLSVIESLSAPNKYATPRKQAYVDERVGAPPPKDAVWPKVPTWLINLITGQKTVIDKTLETLEAEIPNDVFNFSSKNSIDVACALDGNVLYNCNVLGTFSTLEEIQDGCWNISVACGLPFSRQSTPT